MCPHRRSSRCTPRGPAIKQPIRGHDKHCWCPQWHSHLRHCWRPTKCALWSDVHTKGHGEEHLRNRKFRSSQCRHIMSNTNRRNVDDSCMGSRRWRTGVRTRRCHLCHWRRSAVAARWAWHHSQCFRHRRTCCNGPRLRRCLCRARIHWSWQPMVGPICTRNNCWHHTWNNKGTHRSRSDRRDGVSNSRCD